MVRTTCCFLLTYLISMCSISSRVSGQPLHCIWHNANHMLLQTVQREIKRHERLTRSPFLPTQSHSGLQLQQPPLLQRVCQHKERYKINKKRGKISHIRISEWSTCIVCLTQWSPKKRVYAKYDGMTIVCQLQMSERAFFHLPNQFTHSRQAFTCALPDWQCTHSILLRLVHWAPATKKSHTLPGCLAMSQSEAALQRRSPASSTIVVLLFSSCLRWLLWHNSIRTEPISSYKELVSDSE